MQAHHRITRRTFKGVTLPLLAASLTLSFSSSWAATDWPTKPIQLIVPFAAGGTTDLLARLVADGLSQGLKQNVIVENKPGAGANIGAATVARAAPDGYTLLMATPGPLAINPHVYPDMPFDPTKDFAAVSYVADVPNVILANPSTGLTSIPDLIAQAKNKPGSLNWGSPGVGSTGHLTLELLKQSTGVDIAHVPYKGGAQASADLIAGHIQLAGDNVPTALENIRAGKLVALGVTSKGELETLPGVRPVGEAVPNYVLNSWFVIVAPAGTPPETVNKISSTIDSYLKEPAAVEKLRALGAIPIGGTPSDLAKHITSEQARYNTLLKDMPGNKP